MEPQTFWLYNFAAVAIAWGVFGLRFGLSVLAANCVLAAVFFALPQEYGGFNLRDVLLIGYPIYWGIAFLVFRWVEALPLPSSPLPLRIAVGCVVCIGCVVLAHRGTLSRESSILYAVYLAPVEERPVILEKEFADSPYTDICLDSKAELLRLAMGVGDHDVTAVLLQAFTRCHSGSRTMTEVVKPILDEGDLDGLRFLLDSGLKPSMLVYGSAYRGSVLSYAATVARQPDIVRMLIRHDPEGARNLPFLSVLMETLVESEDLAMLHLLHDEGIPIPEQ